MQRNCEFCMKFIYLSVKLQRSTFRIWTAGGAGGGRGAPAPTETHNPRRKRKEMKIGKHKIVYIQKIELSMKGFLGDQNDTYPPGYGLPRFGIKDVDQVR